MEENNQEIEEKRVNDASDILNEKVEEKIQEILEKKRY